MGRCPSRQAAELEAVGRTSSAHSKCHFELFAGDRPAPCVRYGLAPMANSDSDDWLAPRLSGCAITLLILGLGAFVLPLYGREFVLVTTLSEGLGVSPSAAGLILLGAGLLLGIVARALRASSSRALRMRETPQIQLPRPTSEFDSTTGPERISAETLRAVMPHLAEIDRRLRWGEPIDVVVNSIAEREAIDPLQLREAMTVLGPAARHASKGH